MPKQKQPVLHEQLPLIEVAEAWLLDALLADATAAKYIARRLSDTVAVVEPGALDPLLVRMRKLGHTPKVMAD